MIAVVDVFLACDQAVVNAVPLRPPDPGSAGSPFQNWFEDSLVSVGESRQELTSSSPALTKPSKPAEPRPVEEQGSEENRENGQGWRASSA